MKIEDIKLPEEEDRIRFQSGKKLDKLKKSLKKLGQLQNLIIDENNVLIAGWRRYHAMKELAEENPDDDRWKDVKVEVKKGLSALEKFDVELEENWRRQDLTSYEFDIALAKRKKIYEKQHPETSHGGTLSSDTGRFISKKSKVEKIISREDPESQRQNKSNESKPSVQPVKLINEPKPKPRSIPKKPAKAFTESTAEVLGVSPRTIKKHVRVGKAIEKKKFTKEEEKEYKEGRRTFSNMLKTLREKDKKKSFIEDRKIKSELGRKAALKAMKADTEIDSVAVVPPKEPEVKQEKVVWCKDCAKARVQACPECNEQFIICDKGYYVVKGINSEGCEDYE